MKRTRKFWQPERLKVLYCGEYGEQCKRCERVRSQCCCVRYEPGFGRPHYHALLFGAHFPDQLKFKNSAAGGHPVFTSEALSRLWGMGHCTTGAVTFESAAYTARYAMKKITGEDAKAHYVRLDRETGELHQLVPEFIKMSLKDGGIGGNWFKQFASDVYPADTVIMRGREMKPPKRYDLLLERTNPDLLETIKLHRAAYARAHWQDATRERLATREKVKQAQISNLKREMD